MKRQRGWVNKDTTRVCLAWQENKMTPAAHRVVDFQITHEVVFIFLPKDVTS